MKNLVWGFAATALVALPASAQSVKSEVTASNGVKVTVHSDAFAERYEYTAPTMNMTDGFALVAKIVRPGSNADANIQGSFVYHGEWRRYSSALFRGGDSAAYNAGARDVISCSGSRYSRGCSLSESFSINITPAQVRTHARDGVVEIQIRAQDTSTALLSVPVSYIEAVNEVASRRSTEQ